MLFTLTIVESLVSAPYRFAITLNSRSLPGTVSENAVASIEGFFLSSLRNTSMEELNFVSAGVCNSGTVYDYSTWSIFIPEVTVHHKPELAINNQCSCN